MTIIDHVFQSALGYSPADQLSMWSAQNAFVLAPGIGSLKVGTSRSVKLAQSESSRPSKNLQTTCMTTSGRQSTRELWPFARFVRTALWYSPLGILAGRSPSVQSPMVPKARPSSHDLPVKVDRSRMKVFVTGASGGVGSRVVRELLMDGSSVRALVRSKERSVLALQKLGVNVDQYENDGKLEFLVSDLFNLRQEMFQGIDAVISTTGTRVGSEGDTPDRALYYQGRTFYEPKVLEDTPENVEYNGIKMLAAAAADYFMEETGHEAAEDMSVPVWTFQNTDDVQSIWGSLDDVVMGGVSRSSVSADRGELVFTGTVSVSNNGGFASTRSVDFPTPLDLGAFDGISFRAKGDGKRYKFIVRCDGRWDGIGYCFSFDTTPNNWVEVKVPFSELTPVFRARTRPEDPPIDRKHITSIQIMLSKFEYDGALNPKFQAGDFELRIQTIQAYSSKTSVRLPRFVHLGTSGTTRVLRVGEPDLISSVVDFQNKTLDRIIEWKMAGEDAIRESMEKHGYVIVRSTALTLEEPVGLDRIDVAQGDNFAGRISRDDCARLLVESLYSGTPLNTTFEIKQSSPTAKPDDQKFVEKLVNLSVDTDRTSRGFANFPFVPK